MLTESVATIRGSTCLHFLSAIDKGKTDQIVPRKGKVFAQGDDADSVFYLRNGRVRLAVISQTGKEATIGIAGIGDFFGEGSLAGQMQRVHSATAMTDCALLRIDKKIMAKALCRERRLCDLFVAFLLARNIRYEEYLVDQRFNSSEKRLARVLVLLAGGKEYEEPSEAVFPKISHEVLAEMVGTTRPRVSFFMNRFRKLGFIQYRDGLRVNSTLLSVVLGDPSCPSDSSRAPLS